MCVFTVLGESGLVWLMLQNPSYIHPVGKNSLCADFIRTYIYLHLWMNHARYQLNMDKLSAVLQLNVSLNELIWLDVSVVAVAYRCLAGA